MGNAEKFERSRTIRKHLVYAYCLKLLVSNQANFKPVFYELDVEKK